MTPAYSRSPKPRQTATPSWRFEGTTHRHIRSDFGQFADELAANGALAETITPPQAADTIYVLSNEVIHLRLIDECGWSTTQYVSWLADTLQTSLIHPNR
jgi:hypothetical protein